MYEIQSVVTFFAFAVNCCLDDVYIKDVFFSLTEVYFLGFSCRIKEGTQKHTLG